MRCSVKKTKVKISFSKEKQVIEGRSAYSEGGQDDRALDGNISLLAC